MWANSANKFFDTLASGTPVAINYGGWQADMLKKTGAGIVLPPDNPLDAAYMLNELAHDHNRLKEMGKAARRLAEERFSRDMLADQLDKVLIFVVENAEMRR